MNIIENWGSGIPKIFREAKEYGLREPELIDLGSDFRVNLYRKDEKIDNNGIINPKEKVKGATKSATNTQEQIVITELINNPNITQKELHKTTGITIGTIKRIFIRLQEKGKIKRIGSKRSGKWSFNN